MNVTLPKGIDPISEQPKNLVICDFVNHEWIPSDEWFERNPLITTLPVQPTIDTKVIVFDFVNKRKVA